MAIGVVYAISKWFKSFPELMKNPLKANWELQSNYAAKIVSSCYFSLSCTTIELKKLSWQRIQLCCHFCMQKKKCFHTFLVYLVLPLNKKSFPHIIWFTLFYAIPSLDYFNEKSVHAIVTLEHSCHYISTLLWSAFKCLFRLLLWEKHAGHLSHLNGSPPVWLLRLQ